MKYIIKLWSSTICAYLLSIALFVDNGYDAGKEVIIGFLMLYLGYDAVTEKDEKGRLDIWLIWLVLVYATARSFIVK